MRLSKLRLKQIIKEELKKILYEWPDKKEELPLKDDDELAEEKKKNEYAICTISISKTAGTKKRSEWSKEETQRYKNCLKDVNPQKHK